MIRLRLHCPTSNKCRHFFRITTWPYKKIHSAIFDQFRDLHQDFKDSYRVIENLRKFAIHAGFLKAVIVFSLVHLYLTSEKGPSFEKLWITFILTESITSYQRCWKSAGSWKYVWFPHNVTLLVPGSRRFLSIDTV